MIRILYKEKLKIELRNESCHGRQSTDEGLYAKIEDKGSGLKHLLKRYMMCESDLSK